MHLTSPGGVGLRKLINLLIFEIVLFGVYCDSDSYNLQTTDDTSDQTVVVEIGNVKQPTNCSEFINDLEVRSI